MKNKMRECPIYKNWLNRLEPQEYGLGSKVVKQLDPWIQESHFS